MTQDELVEIMKKQYAADALYNNASRSIFSGVNRNNPPVRLAGQVSNVPVVGGVYTHRGNQRRYVVKEVNVVQDLVRVHPEDAKWGEFVETGEYFRATFTRCPAQVPTGTLHMIVSDSDFKNTEPDKPLHVTYFNTQPHECACGISRKDCTYHG